MDMITVSAKTYDEAYTKALLELRTTGEHMKVEVVEKGSNGLFGIIGGKPWVIRAGIIEEASSEKTDIKEKASADLKKEEIKKSEVSADKTYEKKSFENKSDANPEEKNSGNVKAESDIDSEELIGRAERFLSDIFKTMDIKVSCSSEFDPSDNEISILLSSEEDMGILIGKRGQTLDSLQYLVSLVVNKHNEGYIRVKLDTENYRERRKEKLEILARNIASKVKKTRKPVSLEPMNPYERRIIHSVLQEDHYVTTRSEGEDPYRHITVLPRNSQSRKPYGKSGGYRPYKNKNKAE